MEEFTMGLYAFDIELKTEVEANCAIKKPRGCYLCPYERCKEMKVPVFLVETDYGNHYSSYDVSLHHKDCDFISSYKAQYRNKVVTGFEPYNLLDKLLKVTDSTTNAVSKTTVNATTKNTNILTPTTLRKLYYICMSNDLNFHLNDDYTVNDICVSLRNGNEWEEREWDDKILLVVGTVYHVDWKRHSVTLVISKKLKAIFEFLNVDQYQEFYSKLKKFSDLSSVKIAVYGIFHKQDYSFYKDNKKVTYKRNTVKIESLSQIKVLSRYKRNLNE